RWLDRLNSSAIYTVRYFVGYRAPECGVYMKRAFQKAQMLDIPEVFSFTSFSSQVPEKPERITVVCQRQKPMISITIRIVPTENQPIALPPYPTIYGRFQLSF